MNPSDCVSPAASATSAVYARPCCPHASRHVLDHHKFPGGRPPYKSNFYCHPGRAGGTPMLLALTQVDAVSHRNSHRGPQPAHWAIAEHHVAAVRTRDGARDGETKAAARFVLIAGVVKAQKR